MRLAILATVLLAILNGIFSPYWIVVFALQNLWYPFFLPTGILLPVTLTAALLAMFYLLVSAVPAALYEKLSGQSASLASRGIWLATMVVMSWPSWPNLARSMGWS